MDYKNKYNKYQSKCNSIINLINNQSGGKDYKDKYIEKLYNIKEKIKKHGYVFWFGEDGKLLVKDLDDDNAKKKILMKINKDIDEWENKIITEVIITFDKKNILNEESGGLKIDINVNKIITNGKNVSIQQKDKSHSIMTLFYKHDELDNFKISDLKKIVLMIVTKKMKKINPFKFYHYGDIEEYLE